ncbi:MAG: cysteine desulfurase [Pirellulaceae bacterium]|nr:cysteine desulfurase [Pirellulaceae bacterium]
MIYLDNHATTAVDPRVVSAMLPLMTEHYANAGSVTHESGRLVAEQVVQATYSLASHLGAASDELVLTSGATESNNLALFGFALHPRQLRRKIISCVTEHRAILDPLQRLAQQGFEVVLLPVKQQGQSDAGLIDLNQLAQAIDHQTALVTIMLANNEIGAIQPLREIAALCARFEVALHTDATQAIGRMAVDVRDLNVDMLSFSAHKFYGPKGVGGLVVRRAHQRIRLTPQIVGGGQQGNRRSGTLNAPAIVAMARALELCAEEAEIERPRIELLRDRLYARLQAGIDGLTLNGPDLTQSAWRLGGNLNCGFWPVEGQSLMLAVPELAVSSGSACTSAEPRPSHVLQALGMLDDMARSSLRFGVGRFTTESEIDQAAAWLIQASRSLRQLV